MAELVTCDYLRPGLEPQDVCKFLGIKGNYLGHEVQVTIGAPSSPPLKRGQKAGYSAQDAILVYFGHYLIQMGITPRRVKECVVAFRTHWPDIAPPEWIDIDDGSWADSRKHMFLMGTEDQRGFYAVVIPQEDLINKLAIPYKQDAKPRLVQNLTLFAAFAVIDLLRVLRDRKKLDVVRV
jgi:hypothetical protein